MFYDVIIPQTVLEEVKNRSFPIYQRLRNLLNRKINVLLFSIMNIMNKHILIEIKMKLLMIEMIEPLEK